MKQESPASCSVTFAVEMEKNGGCLCVGFGNAFCADFFVLFFNFFIILLEWQGLYMAPLLRLPSGQKKYCKRLAKVELRPPVQTRPVQCSTGRVGKARSSAQPGVEPVQPSG